MSSFNNLWASLCQKKPKLCRGEATVEITSANLKSLLRQFYEKGEASGKQSSVKYTKEEYDFSNIFSDLFGKKSK